MQIARSALGARDLRLPNRARRHDWGDRTAVFLDPNFLGISVRISDGDGHD
jgi:hypothetical protein